MALPNVQGWRCIRSSWTAALICAAMTTSGCANVLGVDQKYVRSSDAEPSADAGTTGSADSGGTGLADAGAIGSGIRCGGGTHCSPPSEECCLSSTDTLSCVSTNGSPCNGGTDIVCDVSTCSKGSVCWVEVEASQSLDDSKCFQTRPTTGDGQWLQLCDPSAPMCMKGTCSPLTVAQFSSWFYACQ